LQGYSSGEPTDLRRFGETAGLSDPVTCRREFPEGVLTVVLLPVPPET
jgi:hypothetical protein